jgi:dCMP deaminase|tara:strand:- start:2902 stop:3354 length:453 start_codon:yes stop_codon:yes gene_type:complete
MEWDRYFLNIAEQVKEKSKDKRTHIGAVIVGKDNEIVSTGYNSFPRGINDNIEERQERPEKYYWIEHAERNAIYNAARIGVSLRESTMYLTCGIPCSDCAKGIISSGIKRIHCKIKDTTRNREYWDEHAKRSLQMFKESGVEVIFYNDNV